MTIPIFNAGDDWTPALLERAWEEIAIVAKEDLRQTYYEPQIEIISAAQMLEAYASVGMPKMYSHWSFGKELINSEQEYETGRMGLALEIVINSEPAIAYLMEENNMLSQTMVIAHASVGHAAVFKHNYLFKERTDASGIIDYLSFAKKYIASCEEKYGIEAVEEILDAAHSLQNYGVDKYKRPQKISPAKEQERAEKKLEQEAADYNLLWETVIPKLVGHDDEVDHHNSSSLKEPQENLLYLIEKRAPRLENWKREVIRIVRKIGEYFSSQGITKVVNEGYASFTHYYIMSRLYEKGLLDSGSIMEFYALHASVLYQRPYTAFNPYKLGFEIFMDIKRLCEGIDIDDEDRKYGARLIGKDWRLETHKAMSEYRDETFILQFLTPKIARKLQIFSFRDFGADEDEMLVTETSRGYSFDMLRERLAAQYTRDHFVPDLQATHIDRKKNSLLTIRHNAVNKRPLDEESAQLVVNHLAKLWQHDVALMTLANNNELLLITATGKYSS
jgi:stage V sporulation protein R